MKAKERERADDPYLGYDQKMVRRSDPNPYCARRQR